ncbi:MAG: hypothetical protein ABEI86_06065 [Halobacteriaceae archaeon]
MTPLCGGGKKTDLDMFEEVTVHEAQRRNKSSCGSCERIADIGLTSPEIGFEQEAEWVVILP